MSVMDQHVMDQYAQPGSTNDGDAVSSALSHIAPAGVAGGVDSIVSLLEAPVCGLLLLRATDLSDQLSEALQARCGISLSTRLQSDTSEHYCIRWMSPDCWLLSCPLDEALDIETSLRKAVTGHIAIVNVSGGYCVLELSGANARQVLMKSTGYDTHPEHLPAGKVVNTTFAKAQVTLRAIEIGESSASYELIIRRSFSDYVWLWLQRAGREFGLVLQR